MTIIRIGRPTLSVKLGTLNWWLRWTGFRVFVGWPDDAPDRHPLTLGIAWFGWSDLRGEIVTEKRLRK